MFRPTPVSGLLLLAIAASVLVSELARGNWFMAVLIGAGVAHQIYHDACRDMESKPRESGSRSEAR